MRQIIFILLAIIGVSQAQTIQYIGAPTTTVISRGNFRTDSVFYLPKRSKAPTDTAALRYQISDSSLYAWTGSQWRKVGADADTLVYSTRAWRQKGDDSLAARINLKVNISDTSSMLAPYLRKSDTTAMLTNYIRHAGYGLTKSGQSFLVDTLNIATRAWRQKGIDSVAGLSRIGGSGTTNYIPKFTGSATVGNSIIQENSGSIGVNGAASPDAGDTRLQINGTTYSTINLKSTDITTFMRAHNPLGMFFIGNTSNHGVGILANDAERVRVFANGRVFIGASPTDAGYQLDVNGSIRAINGGSLATSTGEVLIGTQVDNGSFKLQVGGSGYFGSGTTDNQVLIGFPQDLKFRYRQNVSSAYGFRFDSSNVESLILTSFEGDNQQALLLMGDGTFGNIFGFSHSLNTGATFVADLVIDYNGIVGINTNQPNASAQLDVSSNTRGFLPPRMTTAERDAISSPAAGLLIYNTSTSKLQVYTTSWTDLH